MMTRLDESLHVRYGAKLITVICLGSGYATTLFAGQIAGLDERFRRGEDFCQEMDEAASDLTVVGCLGKAVRLSNAETTSSYVGDLRSEILRPGAD